MIVRLLLFIFLAISLSACVNDDEFYFEPNLSMLCTAQNVDISLQDVQMQYIDYHATSTQKGNRLTHEVISNQFDQVLVEYFEFQIDQEKGCAALATHTLTTTTSRNGRSLTEIKHFPIENFYFTQFEKQKEGELKNKTFFVGKNEDRQFFAIF